MRLERREMTKIRITATYEVEIVESWAEMIDYFKKSPADALEWLMSDDTKIVVENVETEAKVEL
jgi:hypothetical protein